MMHVDIFGERGSQQYGWLLEPFLALEHDFVRLAMNVCERRDLKQTLAPRDICSLAEAVSSPWVQIQLLYRVSHESKKKSYLDEKPFSIVTYYVLRPTCKPTIHEFRVKSGRW